MATIFDDLNSHGYKAVGNTDLPEGIVSISILKETQVLDVVEIFSLLKAHELDIISCKVYISEKGRLRADLVARKTS